MIQSNQINVVVPAYRRPEYLEQLIKSYLLQDADNTELFIVDDSGNDLAVQKLVEKYVASESRIHYLKNETNIGFCKNLIKSITTGEGEYIVVLGDDDMFASPRSLSQIREIFVTHPEVDYIYTNQIQFNKHLEADYIYPHFSKSQEYLKGWSGITNMWLLSCFISGMSFRRKPGLQEKYPEDNILFPQVEMVGKILLESNSFSIAEYLIASRAHNEQLGFKAVKGKDIKNNEKHSVYELGMIYDRIMRYAEENQIQISSEFTKQIVNVFFQNKHMTVFPGEKINTGNSKIISIFIQSFKNDPLVLLNLKYMFYFLVALILPRTILSYLKDKMKSRYLSKFSNERKAFENFVNQLKNV